MSVMGMEAIYPRQRTNQPEPMNEIYLYLPGERPITGPHGVEPLVLRGSPFQGLAFLGTGDPGRCPGLSLGRTVGAERAAAIAAYGHNQIRPRPYASSPLSPNGAFQFEPRATSWVVPNPPYQP